MGGLPADMKAISGHMECAGEWGVLVDMKSHQSTYQRNARRNRSGVWVGPIVWAQSGG